MKDYSKCLNFMMKEMEKKNFRRHFDEKAINERNRIIAENNVKNYPLPPLPELKKTVAKPLIYQEWGFGTNLSKNITLSTDSNGIICLRISEVNGNESTILLLNEQVRRLGKILIKETEEK